MFISVIPGLLALAISPTWIALLGIIPIFLGVRGLIRLWRKRAERGREAAFRPEAPPQAHLHSQVIAVTVVTMAHGADNLGVYIPLFARTPGNIPLYVAVFALMTAFSCLLGHTLIRNRLLAARNIRYGHALVPLFLCGLGLQILWGARPLFLRLWHSDDGVKPFTETIVDAYVEAAPGVFYVSRHVQRFLPPDICALPRSSPTESFHPTPSHFPSIPSCMWTKRLMALCNPPPVASPPPARCSRGGPLHFLAARSQFTIKNAVPPIQLRRTRTPHLASIQPFNLQCSLAKISFALLSFSRLPSGKTSELPTE